jgi:hypothetical protein
MSNCRRTKIRMSATYADLHRRSRSHLPAATGFLLSGGLPASQSTPCLFASAPSLSPVWLPVVGPSAYELIRFFSPCGRRPQNWPPNGYQTNVGMTTDLRPLPQVAQNDLTKRPRLLGQSGPGGRRRPARPSRGRRARDRPGGVARGDEHQPLFPGSAQSETNSLWLGREARR